MRTQFTTSTGRATTGLPRRLTLVSIQLIGFGLVVLGFVALVTDEPPYLGRVFGLLLVLNGVELVRSPTKPHRGLQDLALKLLDRWWSPPAP